jgi:DNA-binding SARP family transcriptional activator/class 3 adenylate cyclase
MTSLKLYLLGPPRLERDGQPIALPLRRALALLAYLAVTDQPQGRETLAALLWPESDETEARGGLRRTLYRLGDAVGERLLIAEGSAIRMAPRADLWVDSLAFRQQAAAGLAAVEGADVANDEQMVRLAQAASLYVDDFLAGFTLPDSPAWDEWQFHQREGLRQTCARLLEQLVRAHQAREMWEAGIGFGRRWLALDPLHEPAHRALMALYAHAGQYAAAIRQYRECARLLDAELGVEPEPATTDLYETIRTRRLALPPATGPPPGPPPAPCTSAPAPPRPQERDGHPSPNHREERRWVTVLVANLSGFAALSERLDPEDVQTLAHRSAERLSEEVRRFGGAVINIMGDSVLAVFGAPVAHEDDAERAVRAGLAIRACQLEASGAADGGHVAVRVGISTGEVMAGLVGPEERRDYTVVGGTVNIAARLMSATSPRTVLVGEETYRATRHRVHYRAVPPIVAEETDRPLPAWEALEITTGPGARPLGTALFVGRDQELAVLVGIWTKVSRDSRPHLVTVLGEPGIGKSRLIVEFERRARGLGDVLLLHGRCLPYGEALGYQALAMALREAAGITAEDGAEPARGKLGDLAAAVIGSPGGEGDPREIARHLALLSGLDIEADRAAEADDRTFQASIRRFLEALARRHPLCLLIEDIHWADQALLNLLEFVASRAQAAPLLIVTQARPELLEKRPTWGGGVRAFTSLPLEPLDGGAGKKLAKALCRERGLSGEMADWVARAAGGNPLFAEELIATIAERRGELGTPSSLKALISARLDSLPSAERRAMQWASVFGTHFWQHGLTALGLDGDVAERLEALEQRDLLRAQRQSRFRDDREYAFRHDLIREVAYQMLPRSERRRLHGLVVDWIEGVAGERADEFLDLLAHHAVQAEQDDRALGYLIRAAPRARRAAAHREEAALLAGAIAIAERIGRTDVIPDLRAARGRAFASVALWADARQELEAALAGLATERRERRAEVLIDLSLVCNWSMDTVALRLHAGEALELAETVGRVDLATDAMFWLAWAAGSDGEVGSAIDQYRRALARSGALRISLAPSVLPLYSTTLCWAGQFGAAIESGREAVQVARAANDTDATILGLQVLGLALAGTGRYDEAMRVFEDARQFGGEHEIGPFLARAIAMSAGFHLDVFDFEGHAALAEEARDLARSVSFPPPLVSASIDLLLNFARRGEVGRADELAGEVASAVEKAAAWHGWLWRLRFTQARAEIALARGDEVGAIRLAGEAVAQSRGKRAKYEALGLVSRAQALIALGRTKEAVADLREAVRVARPVGDPALLLRTATPLLAVDGNDPLAAEVLTAAKRIDAALPTEEMRQRFRAAEPVRRLGPVASEEPD